MNLFCLAKIDKWRYDGLSTQKFDNIEIIKMIEIMKFTSPAHLQSPDNPPLKRHTLFQRITHP